MEFLVEWVPESDNASAEERATLCNLRIAVGEVNACSHWDDRASYPFDYVTVPAVYLAEGVATDWWAIFGGRDIKHPIWRYRTGFILPCLSFSCDGPTFEVSGEQLVCENPGLRFWQVKSEVVSRDSAEKELSRFVERVIEKLNSDGIVDSEVSLRWARVSESRRDPDESAFCEAAGALGRDPYSIDDADAELIEAAGRLFNSHSLHDFLAGVRDVDHGQRNNILKTIEHVEKGEQDSSRLPDLGVAAKSVCTDLRERRPGEGAWAPGYRSAREFRHAITLRDDEYLTSVSTIAEKLGATQFGYTEGLYGVPAVVSRRDDVRIHLRRYQPGAEWSENFNFARAIGDAVCFPDAGFSVVNGLHGAERQAMGRAFAAEFLAPVDKIIDMSYGGKDVDEIAGVFKVSPQLIERQIENRGRIRLACA